MNTNLSSPAKCPGLFSSYDDGRFPPATENPQAMLHALDEDEDVLSAARALDNMRHVGTSSQTSFLDHNETLRLPEPRPRAYSSGTVSTQYTPSLSLGSSSSRSTNSLTNVEMEEDDKFMSRVSNMPFVGTAIRVYEHGKASSRVVKYGAEMMEGTVKTMTRPVIDRLPVNTLDEFACRQLNRFGRLSGKPDGDNTTLLMQVDNMDLSSPKSPHGSEGSDTVRRRGRKHLWIEDGNKDTARHRSTSRDSESSSHSPSETAFSASSGAQTRYQADPAWNAHLQQVHLQNAPAPTGQEVQVVSRSKWQAVLLEAGGIGAAVSQESMKRLKYCLQWLQYSNHTIDQQILLLRSFIVSISPENTTASSSDALVPFQSLEILARVKSELISTIRQVVDVVSKYAGGALPEQARNSVRSFILMLPERWSSAARDDAYVFQQGQAGLSSGAAMLAATRVLTLATESLDMMRSVSGVFKDSLDRAEAWVDRLQQLGLQRQQQRLVALPGSEWDAVPSGSLSVAPHPTASSANVPLYPFQQAQLQQQAQQHQQSLPVYEDDGTFSLMAHSAPPSTRAASDSGDDTETEGTGTVADDVDMSAGTEDPSVSLHRRRGKSVANDNGEDMDMGD